MKKTALFIGMVICLHAPVDASVISEAEEFYWLLESGRFEEATQKIDALGNDAMRHFWKSRLSFYRGDYRDAYGEMDAALRLPASKPWWEELRNYYYYIAEISYDFHSFPSEHFICKAKGRDVILAGYLLEALEKAYREVGSDLNAFPEQKITVEVYPDKKEFSLASTLSEELLEKTGTVGICKFNKLMILSPSALPLGYSWLDTVSHEYVHFLVNYVSKTRCPLWLHEGIARYYETRWRVSQPEFLTSGGEKKLGEAIAQNALISFDRMSPSLVYLKNQDEIMLAFAEVATAVDYIKKEFGFTAIPSLLKNYALENEKAAFKRSLGISLKAFERRWSRYLKTVPLETAGGALTDEVLFKEKPEEEFIGADAKGHIRLGNRMREIRRFEAALANYNKALELEPANPVILLKIARTLQELGRKGEAAAKLKEAILKNPHYVTPFQVLGALYHTEGQHEQCIEILTRAVAINPFHPETHRLLARSYIALQRYAQAVPELRIVLILDPQDHETKTILERLK